MDKDNISKKPTREGFEFLGFFTEKNEGTKLELILAESGIDSDMTFYAHWKESSQIVESTSQIENNNNVGNIENSNSSLDVSKNPRTSDDIMIFAIVFIVSLSGIIVIRKIKKAM